MKNKPLLVISEQARRVEHIRNGLADLLCWCRGYVAGQPDSDKHPIGIDECRTLHIWLKDALEEIEPK